MQEEANPVKEILFDYIKKSEKKIQKIAIQNKYSEIIDNIIQNCHDQIITINTKEDSLGVLATGILHYLLTNALIPSQRKIVQDGIEIDIVIPDVKTLLADPKKSLVILIPRSSNQKIVQEKLDKMNKIQPIEENIWLVLSEKSAFKNKTFVIGKNNPSFSNIVYDISQFVNTSGQNKFKILRIN